MVCFLHYFISFWISKSYPILQFNNDRHRRFQTSRIALWCHLQSWIKSTAGASDSFLWFDHFLVDCRPVQLHFNIHTWRKEERHSDCNHLTEAVRRIRHVQRSISLVALVAIGYRESNERQPAVLYGMWPARMPLSYKSHIYRQSRRYFNVEPDSTLFVRRYQGIHKTSTPTEDDEFFHLIDCFFFSLLQKHRFKGERTGQLVI